jgi:hypothetical protein
LTISAAVSAHPVTFKGGNAFYATRQQGMVRYEMNHTFSRHIALGTTYISMDLPDFGLDAGLATASVLAYRRNGNGSQGNVYLTAGGGYGDLGDGSGGAFLGMGNLQIDFETSRIYAAVVGSSFYLSPLGTSLYPGGVYGVQGRFGLAPYVARFDELQSWLVLQAGGSSVAEPMLTPMLRFFYRTVLWEVGFNQHGEPWLQLMVHY